MTGFASENRHDIHFQSLGFWHGDMGLRVPEGEGEMGMGSGGEKKERDVA